MSGDPIGYGTGCACPGSWWGVGAAPMCDACRFRLTACAPTPTYQTLTATTSWPPTKQLSDDDIERIAQRVAELLRPAAVVSEPDDPEPLSCGCPAGRHGNNRNYLEGAAEEDGPICSLGWPV